MLSTLTSGVTGRAAIAQTIFVKPGVEKRRNSAGGRPWNCTTDFHGCVTAPATNDKQQAEPMAPLMVLHLEQAGIERPKDAGGGGEKIPGTYESGYDSEAAAQAVEQWGVDP
jgi:hypothetical protein